MPEPADPPILCLFRTCDLPATVRIHASPYCRDWHACNDHAPAMVRGFETGGPRACTVTRVNLDPRRCEECGSPEAECLERQVRSAEGTHAYVPHVPRRVVVDG